MIHIESLACDCSYHKVISIHGIKIPIGCNEEGEILDINLRNKVNSNPVLRRAFEKANLVESDEG